MESIAERLERKLTIQQKELKHNVRTVVPVGYEPYELMSELKAEDEWLQKTEKCEH